MNEKESNFEQLRKLIALKNRETPPPGYFNDFSGQVVDRIRLGETSKNADGVLGKLFSEAPWLLRFIQIFEAKPAYAGAVASGLFMLLVAGIVYSDHPDAAPDSLMPPQTAEATPAPASLASISQAFLTQSAPSADTVSSTNPVLSLQAGGSAFGDQAPLFQTAAFTH